MKKQDDLLATSHWFKNIITDPYQVIAEFFAADDIVSYRKMIKGMLLAACSKQIYQRDEPGHLLFEFKMMESVINAANLINKEKKKSPIYINTNDLLNKNLYFGKFMYLNEWDYFPRTLSKKEYIDPYLVFKNFFKFQSLEKWKDDLHEILDYALIEANFFDDAVEINIFSIYFHLTKLVEAAHLIDVREVTHVNGHIKNKTKQ